MVVLGGCGSRGPLDEATNVVVDAGPEAEAELIDAAVEAETPVHDGGREGGPVACGVCVLTTCGDQILACIQSDSCRAVFQCVATTCLGGNGGGGLNPACLFQCAGEDPAGALAVLGVFQCITGECGADCGSVLGGLGGLPGSGGNGGKGGNGGNGGKGKEMPDGIREIFSPWPELFTPVPEVRRSTPVAPKTH